MAPQEFNELMRAIIKYNPYIGIYTDQGTIAYYNKYELKFQLYDKNTRSGLVTPTKDLYPKEWHKLNVQREQDRILIRQWGNRNPIDGRYFIIDKKTGYPIEQIVRHHYKWASDPQYNKLDCRISAQVPIPISEHIPAGDPHSALWERRFTEAKYCIEKGIAYIPRWWSIQEQINYEKDLKNSHIVFVKGTIR